jgi:HD-like signal output (HDOD) protein
MQRFAGKPNALLLSRFDQLAHLEPERLEALAAQVDILEVPKGTPLVELGSLETDTVFLVSGRVRLEAEDGRSRFISEQDPAARSPLCRLRPSRWRALAASDVRYLRIREELIATLGDDQTPATYEVTELSGAAGTLPGGGDFLVELVNDLNRHCLVVPSLPQAASYAASQILEADGEPAAIARALLVDPALALKAMQAANTRDPGAAPVRSCRSAVERLGADTVYGLAVHCAFREAFRSPDPAMHERFREWWRLSLLTGRLARQLGGLASGFDPELAELVGLTHDIGRAIVLNYGAKTLPADASDEGFPSEVAYASRLLLGRWHLPQELMHAAERHEDWLLDSGRPGYADIAVVARRMALLKLDPDAPAPPLREMPAARRLHPDLRDADRVEQMLSSARAAIDGQVLAAA